MIATADAGGATGATGVGMGIGATAVGIDVSGGVTLTDGADVEPPNGSEGGAEIADTLEEAGRVGDTTVGAFKLGVISDAGRGAIGADTVGSMGEEAAGVESMREGSMAILLVDGAGA